MTRRGLVLFGLMSVIWGIPYLFIRIAVDEIPPATLVFVRTVIGAAILLPIALLRVDLRPVLRRWRWLVAFAAVEIALPWFFLASAEQHISSSLAGLLIAGVPLVGTAIALATGGADRLGRTALLGLLLGLVGVVAIVGVDFEASDATAFVQILLVVIGYARGTGHPGPPPGRPAVDRGDGPVPDDDGRHLRADRGGQWPSVVPSPNALIAVAILGIVCTALAFQLFAALISEVGPVRATVITYVNPAVAAVLGVLVLHETFTVPMAVGFVLVILGSAFATRRSRADAPLAAPEPSLTAG